MLATLSLIAAIAPAQAKAPDADSILKSAVAAGAKLKTVKYSVESKAGDIVVRSTVWQANGAVPHVGLIAGRFRIKGTLDDGNGPQHFEMAYDGRALRVKNDSDEVQILEDPSPYQAGQHTPMGAMFSTLPMMGGFFGPETKRKVKYLGTKKVGKWTCDLVEIRRRVESPVEGEIELVSEWAFDRASHLPVQNKSGRSLVTATSLELNPKIDEALFKMSGTAKAASKLGPQTENLLPLGSIAPEFTVDLPDGQKWNLSDHKGKVVVLDFWATWCVPCRKVMPVLDEIHKTYKDRVEVLGISVDREHDPVPFIKRFGHEYRIGLRGYDASDAYAAKLLPTVYVIDQEGRIAFRFAGIPEEGPGVITEKVRGLLPPDETRS